MCYDFAEREKAALAAFFETCQWQSLKLFFIYIFTFLKSEIHHYFVNFFKVSGRSVEEMLIDELAYFFDNFFDSFSKNVFL